MEEIKRPLAIYLDEDGTACENAEQRYALMPHKDVAGIETGTGYRLHIIVDYPYRLDDLAGIKRTPEQRSGGVQLIHKKFQSAIKPLVGRYQERVSAHYQTDVTFGEKSISVTPAKIEIYKGGFETEYASFSQYAKEIQTKKEFSQFSDFAAQVNDRRYHFRNIQMGFSSGSVFCHTAKNIMETAEVLAAKENKTALLCHEKNSQDIIAVIPNDVAHPSFTRPLFVDADHYNLCQGLIMGEMHKNLFKPSEAHDIVRKLYNNRTYGCV